MRFFNVDLGFFLFFLPLTPSSPQGYKQQMCYIFYSNRVPFEAVRSISVFHQKANLSMLRISILMSVYRRQK